MSRQYSDEERWIAQVADAFDEVTAPPRPNDDDILARMRETDSAESSGSVSRFRFWRYWNMKTAKRWTIAAAVVVLIAALTGIFMPARFSPQQSFAQMVANVQQMRTAVMHIAMTIPSQPSISMTMYIDNAGKMRQEMTIPVAELPQPMKMANVIDFQAGRMLTLIPDQKQAMTINMGDLPSEQIPRNLVDEFRKLPPDAGQWKDKITEDGRTLLVYEVKQQADMMMTVWVDQATLLPVRSRIQMPSPMGEGQMLMEINDIQWDAPLPEGAFDLTPPEGYTVRHMDMNLSNASPQDVLTLLRLWTYLSDGAFPEKFDQMSINFDFQQQMRDYVERVRKQGGNQQQFFSDIARDILGVKVDQIDEETTLQIVQKLGGVMARGGMVLAPYFKDETFVYTGQGAHLGDENRVICYWPDADGKHYHAIDARLNLISLTAEQLPPATNHAP